jgi:hypothetical protein
MVLFLVGCIAHGPPIRLDPSVSLELVSPAPGSHPYTIDVAVRSAGDVGDVELRVGGERIGAMADNGVYRWRAPQAGPVTVEVRGVRDGVVVALDTVDVEVGVGLSDAVARVVDAYPADATLGFYWPPDDGVWWGTTRDLWYRGTLLSPGDPERRSHCVGLTWEVAMAVLAEQAGGPDLAINGLSIEDIQRFRTDWFVREVRGPGAAEAAEHFGVGERVPLDDLRRGDFLQMWTPGGAGHSGVFDAWVLDGDKRIGVRYWSTHPALNGIGYWSDSLGPSGLDTEHLYAARLWQKVDWLPPDSGSR